MCHSRSSLCTKNALFYGIVRDTHSFAPADTVLISDNQLQLLVYLYTDFSSDFLYPEMHLRGLFYPEIQVLLHNSFFSLHVVHTNTELCDTEELI